MRRISSFVLGVVTTVALSACGSDEGTGKGTGGSSAGGNSSMGGVGTGTTGGTGTGTTGGSKATGGTGGTSGNACQNACQKLLGAKCGDITAADCTDGCDPGTACVAESDAFYGCINTKGTVSCDATNTTVAGCATEDTALGVCTVCLPHTGDTDCATCTRSTCCAEVKSYISAADVSGYDACITPCQDQDCVDACAKQYPLAGKADASIDTCQGKSCVDSCVCGADATDSACVACVKTTCCADFAKYVTASDAGAFSTCIGACADTDAACFDACITEFPIAGPAYESLITGCVSNDCATSCGG
ncbi:MAG TPA: hypothetical protein VG937_06095 [Polyangiaceae bacterium]|nr:hypothetical protein [Polyangiaceae bacterium]